FFFSSRRRHTRFSRDWSSDVCSSDLLSRLRPPLRKASTRKVAAPGVAVREESAEPAGGHHPHRPLLRQPVAQDRTVQQDPCMLEIGRASCRERVQIAVGGGAVTRK